MKQIKHHHKAIIGLAGFSGSGKTTLAEKLIKHLTDANVKIASIKHAHHNFEIDQPGKDSWRHRKAGSNEIVVSSSKRIVHIKEKSNSKEEKLEEILKMISPKELVIIEGFKKEPFPKIEVIRKEIHQNLLFTEDKNIIALATDIKIDQTLIKNKDISILPLNNVKVIKDFILKNYLSDNKEIGLFNNRKNYISFERALDKIKKNIKPIKATTNLPLVKCSKRILAKSIFSKYNLPNKDNAAVDGYGFSFDDYNHKLGSSLPIYCKVKAGLSQNLSIPKGYAIRVFTGAVLPEKIDTIAMQEDCKILNNKVLIPPKIVKGLNRRPSGENLKKNQLVISSGKKLNSSDIGLLASSGYSVLPVINNLKIAIISSGNEIIKSGERLKDGLVFDSNGLMLYDLVSRTQNKATSLGIVKDEPKKIINKINQALLKFDLIIVSAGASEGEEDHIKNVIKFLNGKIHFWGISIKPGRPMGFATIKNIPIFCLPGNPVAAFICFKLFVEPSIQKRSFSNFQEPIRISAIANFDQKSKLGRREFLRGKFIKIKNKILVDINGKPGAGVLSSFSGADGLIEIPENTDKIKFGDNLSFIPFREVSL